MAADGSERAHDATRRAGAPPDGPPVIVLGVRRSGTTLLRVMLDRSRELAIPDETYFVTLLAERHRGPLEKARFLDDLRRLPRVRELNVPLAGVETRVRDGMPPGQAIAAVFEAYADARGKRRWGDKTPLYMQYLPLLERLFPQALFVHLVRDGRDAAQSFLELPEGLVARSWAHPRSATGVACQWRTEILAARRLGDSVGPRRYLELRYERLVGEPEAELERVCAFAGLAYDPAMLDYPGKVDLAGKPHQERLRRPPTPGVRDWRREMAPQDVAAFETVAGDVLAELGYELANPAAATGPHARARAALAAYGARVAAWRAAAAALRRSPLWARRHPRVA
jgi:hypothetical protein